MSGEKTKSNAKWINFFGLILILIVFLRFGRIIILDIGLIEPNRLHAQYINRIDQIGDDIFGDDPFLLSYEYKIEQSPFSRKYEFVSDEKLIVGYFDTIYLTLYLGASFDSMSDEERLEYIRDKTDQFWGRVVDIQKAVGYRGSINSAKFRYKPNINAGTDIETRAFTEEYIYWENSDGELIKQDNI